MSPETVETGIVITPRDITYVISVLSFLILLWRNSTSSNEKVTKFRTVTELTIKQQEKEINELKEDNKLLHERVAARKGELSNLETSLIEKLDQTMAHIDKFIHNKHSQEMEKLNSFDSRLSRIEGKMFDN